MFKLLDYPLYEKPVREIRFENDSDDEIDIVLSDRANSETRHVYPRQTVSFMTEHPLYYLFTIFQDGVLSSKSYPVRSNSNYIPLKKTAYGDYQPTYMIQTAPPSY